MKSKSRSSSVLIVVGLFAVLTLSPAQSSESSEELQKHGLEQHNSLRKVHGSPAMILDPELCQAAQKCAEYYAARGLIDHTCTSDAGENLASETWTGKQPSDEDFPDIMENGISGWYGEMKDYNYEDPGASTGFVDHGTQLLWKDSTRMCTGVATKDGFTAVVAQYMSPGNIMSEGDDPYKFYFENISPPN